MNSLKTALLLGLLSGIILFMGKALGGTRGLEIALCIAVTMNFVSYWWSDRIVLFMHGAKEIAQEENPGLHQLVGQLALSANIPKPRIYYVDSPAPNAFATGRNPAHGAVAVTGGLLKLMSDHELRGVLAHELAHIRNRDILISSVAATLAATISYVAGMARWALILGGGRGDRDDDGGAGALVMLIIAPILALLIQLWISRTREYAADASGARIAGTPYGLANALLKLDSFSKRVPMNANPATAHLYIVSPLAGGSIMRVFSTHPPIGERVERLRRMA